MITLCRQVSEVLAPLRMCYCKKMHLDKDKDALVVNASMNGNKGPSRIMMRRGARMKTGFHWLSCPMQVTRTGRMD